MNSAEAARKLGVEPASLSPAPAAPRFAETWKRMQKEPPCSACGQPSRTSSVIHEPAHGPRWFDRCRGCFLATPPTLPASPAQFLEELREAAADARMRLHTYTDESGWEGE
ncbi:hypothetical protein [Streptomyces luteogriseus]|uniref:hypothetical protein n=1 Tax=Streptomyces luteogriseus TaxID=68233 RepID=UPI002E37B4D1|nr:hypothetical protein [Streptomyces luteogriseus]WTJ25596.1 hypothetical protein OID52_00160 [Streptomyces luteogriseus]WTJ33016.1 hypothetical protein OID52_41340 [Streptomyces luteogriseus]